MRSAIYAGSFDPVHNGHLDVIRRGAALYDRLVVAVGSNPAKRSLFTADERVALIVENIADLPHVEVVTFEGLLIHAAQRVGADVLLRSLRTPADFDIELRNGLANRDMCGIETVFLLASPAQLFVSSSLIKEIAINGGDVSRYIPANVNSLLPGRLAR